MMLPGYGSGIVDNRRLPGVEIEVTEKNRRDHESLSMQATLRLFLQTTSYSESQAEDSSESTELLLTQRKADLAFNGLWHCHAQALLPLSLRRSHVRLSTS